MSFQERLKFFQSQSKANTSNIKIEPPKKIPGKIDINKIFGDGKKSEANENNKDIRNKPISFMSIEERKKMFEKKEEKTDEKKEKIEEKILEGSEIFSEEDPDMTIYEYPKYTFRDSNYKVLVFFGNKQINFINTFINTYRDISFDDKFRYTIEKKNCQEDKKNLFSIYNIKSFLKTKTYNIKIICVPYFNQNNNIFKNYETLEKLLNIIKKIPKKFINLLCLTLEKTNNKFNEIEKHYFKLFLNLFDLNDLKDKLLVLFPSNENIDDYKEMVNDLLKIEPNDYLFNENVDYISKLNPEYIPLNNKIIFENNKDENLKKEWDILLESMQKIHKKIDLSVRGIISEEKIKFINSLIAMEEKDRWLLLKEIKKYNRIDQIIFTNYLVNIKMRDLNFFLYNLLKDGNPNSNNISRNLDRLYFKNDKNANKSIKILSKFDFEQLKNIIVDGCEINDNDIKNLQRLFTEKLINLNLSNNKNITSNIFNKGGIYTNLENLNLSNNNLDNLDFIINTNFSGLKKLNVSKNKIKSIECLGNNNENIQNLEYLNLSYNNIKKLNEIKIGKLKALNLMKNEIDNGITEFLNNSTNVSHTLLIEYNKERNKNEIIFKFTNKVNIKFNYIISYENVNDFLKTFSFKNIHELIIKGFDDNDIDFLSNESLEELKQLNLKKSNITDISIFENVKFQNIEGLIFNKGCTIKKGLHYLNKFNKIKLDIVKIKYEENKYKCFLKCYSFNLTLHYISDNFDFFNDELFSKAEILIVSNTLINNQNNYFNYNSFKNYLFPIYKNIVANKVNIEYSNNKYNCTINFKKPYFKMNFIFDDLNFIENDNILKETRKLGLKHLNLENNINFSSSIIFKNLKRLNLIYNIILNINFFKAFDELKKNNKDIYIRSLYNSCYSNLLKPFQQEKDLIKLGFVNSTKESLYLAYDEPLPFTMYIGKNQLNDIESLEYVHSISLKENNLTDNDISFLKNKKYLNLYELILDKNNITNIDFLSTMTFENIAKISLYENPINNGLEIIENNLKGVYAKFKSIDYGSYKLLYRNGYYIGSNKKENPITFDYLFNNMTLEEIFGKIKLDIITGINFIEPKENLSLISFSNFNHLEYINLSETSITDINRLCNSSPNLKILNLSYNPNITNFDELKNAVFTNLIELNLSNNNIDDLDKIKMKEYPFDDLSILDLSNNKISHIFCFGDKFKKLTKLNLENNNINKEDCEYIKIRTYELNIDGNNIPWHIRGQLNLDDNSYGKSSQIMFNN